MSRRVFLGACVGLGWVSVWPGTSRRVRPSPGMVGGPPQPRGAAESGGGGLPAGPPPRQPLWMYFLITTQPCLNTGQGMCGKSAQVLVAGS